eukprot:4053842-Pyramimonas_sp.AAC.1
MHWIWLLDLGVSLWMALFTWTTCDLMRRSSTNMWWSKLGLLGPGAQGICGIHLCEVPSKPASCRYPMYNVTDRDD